MFKQKTDNPVFSLSTIIVTIIVLFPNYSAAQQSQLGKYLCVISRMVGIQFSNGTTSSGNFKPPQDKFFLSVRTAKPMAGCPNLFGKDQGLLNWFSCAAKFEAQIDSGPLLRGDDDSSFMGTGLAMGDYLRINYDSGIFDSNTNVLTSGGLFTSDGKCTKVA